MKVKSCYDIFIGEYPFHKQLKDDLFPKLYNYKDALDKKTNVKATMTDWEWGCDNVRVERLRNCILEETKSHFNYGVVNDKLPKLVLSNLWANVYWKNEYAIDHDHIPFDVFSFAYFLSAKWYHPPLTFSYSGVKIRPKEGRYVIFPSHLRHHVPKNRFEEPRITLSGNLRVVDEP